MTLQLFDGLHWCGVQDPGLRVFDIIMRTEYGTTYNSYLLRGSEKTALIETAKETFAAEYLEKVLSLCPAEELDYIVLDHTEPDHAGSLARLLEMNPAITVVGSMGAINFLKEIVNRPFTSRVVKDNDTLSLGNRTLQFMALPNLHWPDTMYSWCPELGVLFTCDSFGSHYSHPGVLRSNVPDKAAYLGAARYYFDCILGPFKRPYMQNALRRIADLPIRMVCPGHGPVLDEGLAEMRALYEAWCAAPAPQAPLVVMPYVSAYGYTAALGERIAAGVAAAGVTVERFDMVDADRATVLGEIARADGLLFGTPTILGDALEPIWALLGAMVPTVHGGKAASAFGSYGWSGEGVPHVMERLKQLKLKVFGEGLRVRFKPSAQELETAYQFGLDFAAAMLNK